MELGGTTEFGDNGSESFRSRVFVRENTIMASVLPGFDEIAAVGTSEGGGSGALRSFRDKEGEATGGIDGVDELEIRGIF